MGAKLREGAIVRTVIEGEVVHMLEDDNRSHVTIKYLDVDGDPQRANFVPASKVEVLPEPLKVGDVVTRETPEPPVGSVVHMSYYEQEIDWFHGTPDGDDCTWHPSTTYFDSDSWSFVSTVGTPTIAYLPEAS